MCTQFTALKVFNVFYWSGSDNYAALTLNFNSFLVVCKGGVSSGNTGIKGWGCHQEAGKENSGNEISKLVRNLPHLPNLQQ